VAQARTDAILRNKQQGAAHICRSDTCMLQLRATYETGNKIAFMPSGLMKQNSMTSIRQKIMRVFYPLLMKTSQWLGRQAGVVQNKTAQLFQTPIYDLSVTLNDNTLVPLAQWRGLKILIVNTASDCGYTAQYAELQRLQDRYPETLRVLGIPSNDFKGQEPGTNAAIAQFCKLQYGVTFPLAQKSSVLAGTQQHPVYQWLTQAEKNGWNRQAPRWNFSKYLINEHGVLTHYFDPAVSPLSSEVRNAIET
jgi:glutathione peroxidase